MTENPTAFAVPASLPVGKYKPTVIADFAHNIGSQEVTIEVVPQRVE